MRITILAVGSRGDVQPYIALGLGLAKAGHRVRVASSPDFEPFVREHTLDYAPMGSDFRALMDSEATRRVLDKSNPVQFLRDQGAAFRQAFERFAYDSSAACAGSDAIIFSTVAVPGFGVAEMMRVPCFWAPLTPMSRTREFPSFFLSRRNLGGPLNWLSHLAEEQLVWQPFRQFVNQWRRESLGLAPFPFGGPFDLIERTRLPTLYGYSPVVLPKPSDWGDWMHVTGYWFLDRPDNWHPPAALADFIANGPPPVYIGFGSMNHRKPEQVTQLVIHALGLARQRGILATGWGGLGDADLPETVFKIDAIPHDWLFPQMAAVVHHGGAGTTGAGLRAGIPSIVVPFTVDQPFWAQRVYALGVGTQPIPRNQLTAERLAAAIRQAVSDGELRKRAAAIGERVRREDGVECAISAFENHIQEYN